MDIYKEEFKEIIEDLDEEFRSQFIRMVNWFYTLDLPQFIITQVIFILFLISFRISTSLLKMKYIHWTKFPAWKILC